MGLSISIVCQKISGVNNGTVLVKRAILSVIEGKYIKSVIVQCI